MERERERERGEGEGYVLRMEKFARSSSACGDRKKEEQMRAASYCSRPGRKVRKLQSPLSLPLLLLLQVRCQAKPSDERGGIDSTDAGGKKQNINYPEMAKKKYIARRGEGKG